MIFADALIDSQSTITAIVAVFLANMLQTWYTNWKQKRTVTKIEQAASAIVVSSSCAAKAATKIETVAENTDETHKKLDGIHEILNGKGVTKMLKESKEWQDRHEKLDNERHEQIIRLLDSKKEDVKEAK